MAETPTSGMGCWIFLPITLVAMLTFMMGFIRGVHRGR